MIEKQASRPKLTEQVKVPPHSIDAERSVLGGLMLDDQVLDQVMECLNPPDFYRPEHQIMFNTMIELAERDSPLDVLTLSEALKERNLLEEVGGEVYLFEIAKNTPSVANISAYADIVRERSVLRQLINTATDIANSAFQAEGRPSSELLDEAESKVFKIADQSTRGGGPINIKRLLSGALDRLDQLFHSEGSITGLPTGYKDLDELTSGLQQSDLVIIAGRPSMGKTTFAMNIVENALIKAKKPVLVFSMEMPADSIVLRMLSSLGRVDQNRIRSGKLSDEDWARITSTVSMLSDVPLFIDDTPGLTPTEIRARARRVAKEHGQLGLIVIDYLQLMKATGFSADNRVGEISEISRSLKALAKELNVPIIAASQLNRSLEQRADKRPMMSDLRESGAIEQDADIIIFIYRDEVYNENTPDKGISEIIIAKQRNGPIGKVRLSFFGKYTRFDNLSRSSYSVGENV